MSWRACACVVVACCLVGAGCGPSSTTSSSGTAVPNAGPTAPPVRPGFPSTTQFAFPPRPTGPFVAGEGTITLAGDLQATARFSSASCAGITVTEMRGFLATLVFSSAPETAASRTYLVDLAGLSPGRTTFPEPAGFNQTPPRRVRLTTESSGAVLMWGTTAAGTGNVAGTVSAAVGNARSGSFELDLGFAGDEKGAIPPSSARPVHASGNWNCP